MCLCTPSLQCPRGAEDSILSHCDWSYSWYSEQPDGCWQSSSRRRASIPNSWTTAPVPPPSHPFYVELVCVCRGAVHTCHVCSSQRTPMGVSSLVLSFHCVNSRDWALVIRLGSKCFSLLSETCPSLTLLPSLSSLLWLSLHNTPYTLLSL